LGRGLFDELPESLKLSGSLRSEDNFEKFLTFKKFDVFPFFRIIQMKNNEILLLPNEMYHIYNHANGRENLFEQHGNYIFFLKRYQYFVEPIAETYAYCLMPNHLHLMVRIKNEDELQKANKQFVLDRKSTEIKDLAVEEIPVELLPLFVSKTFGSLFSSYTQSFNKQQKRKGSLFIPNFKRKTIEDERYFAQIIHYIHNNPVHHGFAKDQGDWPYSSYQTFLTNKKTRLKREEVLNWFGDLNGFLEYHNQPGKFPEDFDLDLP
jgi:putative transposase